MEGSTLSHFRILSKIGHGGMGVVYKAEDVNLGRTVAIKVLPADLVQDPTRRARFVAEGRIAAAVTHPNIATIHEIDEADGTTFIAMEYLEGETLRRRMTAQPIALKQSVQIGVEIAEGLAAAHGAKIVHRDLKPDNVMITRDGHVKILDFGLARLLEPAASDSGPGAELTAAQTQVVTDPDQVIGTPAYMSPEQARGLEVDFRTDIFSFGCTFYELITGQRPFRGATSTDTLSDILNKDPLPATSLNPDLPSSVQWILEKCLDKDAGERYQDTRDLVVDLHHLQRECQALTTSSRAPDTQQVPAAGMATPQPTPSGPDSFAFGVQTPTQQAVSGEALQSAAGLTTSGVTQPAPVSARKRYVGLAVAIVVTAAAAFGLTRVLDREQAPVHVAEANSLAIFAFENLKDSTDPQRYGQIFQDVLIVALSGLEPLKVYSGQRLFDIQKQLSKDGDKAFDKQFATTVARHAGAERMLTGSLGQLGEKWILTCQMVEVADGSVVFSKRIDGEDLYEVADVLTDELQSDLRIAAPSEVSHKISVREKTSSSMEAYRHYLEGMEQTSAGKWTEAALAFEKAIEIDPDFGQPYYRLAQALFWPGNDPRKAQGLLRELLDRELYASDKEKRMAEVMMMRIKRQDAEALPLMEQLTRDFPDEKETWFELADLLYHWPGGGKRDESVQAFEKALELDPEFLLSHEHIFDAAFDERRFDDAIKRADKLIQRDPENPLWYRFKARSLSWVTDDSEMDAVVDAALAHNTAPSDRRELYTTVAIVMMRRGYAAKQEAYLRKALDADPEHDDPSTVRLLMNLLTRQERWDEFEDWVRAELEKNPRDPVMLAQLFRVHDAKRRYADGLVEARRLAREDPDDAQWTRRWLRYAILRGDADATATALAAANEAASTTDDRRRLYDGMGRTYGFCGYVNRGLESVRKAMDVEPERPYAYLLLNAGYYELSRNRYDAAKRWFERALEVNPEYGSAHWGLFWMSLNQNDKQAAREHAERGFELGTPNNLEDIMPGVYELWDGHLSAAQTAFESYVSGADAPWVRFDRLGRVGNSYADEGHYELALDPFRRGMELEKSRHNARMYNGAGLCQLLAGDLDAAAHVLRDGLQTSRPSPTTRLRLGIVYSAQGKFDEAERFLNEAREIQTWVEVAKHLALVHAARGRWADARLVAETCVDADSSRASHELLAWVLVAGDLDVERGVSEAERALQLTPSFRDHYRKLPTWPPAEHTLGLAALKQNAPQRAVEHLRRAVERSPERNELLADLKRAEAASSDTP